MTAFKISLLLIAAFLLSCQEVSPKRTDDMKIEIIKRPYKNVDLATKQLNKFVVNFNPQHDVLPKQIDPEQVASFLVDRLRKGNLSPSHARQMMELADFYDLKQLLPEMLVTLTRDDMTESQFLVAVAFTQGVGILSAEEELAQGQEYFRYLLSTRFSRSHMPELLTCLNEFSPTENTTGTAARFESWIKQLAQSEADAVTNGVEIRELQDMQSNMLPRIAKAAERKDAIRSIPETSDRLDRLVKIYLGLSLEYKEWMSRWAVRSILREYYYNGALEPIKAFRRAIANVDMMDLPVDDKKSLRQVCYHAIDFFGGQLAENERTECKELPPNLSGLLTLD